MDDAIADGDVWRVRCDNAAVLASLGELPDVARVVLVVSVGAFVTGELVQTFRARRAAKLVDVRAEVVFRVMFFGAILLWPIGRAIHPAAGIGGAWPFPLGIVIGWLGLVLRWWSFISLGKYFTVTVRTSEDQPVVERGPYRVLRHPTYTGLLLVFSGGGLIVNNWVSAAGAGAVLLVALIHRLRIEERALEEALGGRYRQFAANRARLVPFVW
ncbi:methyltransferase family protein [Amycolatopsis sp. cmx-4-68]|uniref:methyltransferase family protein n=1 Tax=Amycolatopsis sp. cmx-4-68 TaxID=2790938 RepID=UPI00397D92E9